MELIPFISIEVFTLKIIVSSFVTVNQGIWS